MGIPDLPPPARRHPYTPYPALSGCVLAPAELFSFPAPGLRFRRGDHGHEQGQIPRGAEHLASHAGGGRSAAGGLRRRVGITRTTSPSGAARPGTLRRPWPGGFGNGRRKTGISRCWPPSTCGAAAPRLEAGSSAPGEGAVRVPVQLPQRGERPEHRHCGSGPEFLSRTLPRCAGNEPFDIALICTGKPCQNMRTRRFNGTFRGGCPSSKWLSNLFEL